MSAVAMNDAFPLLSTNPLVGRNNSRDFRKFFLQGLMFGPGASSFTRRGVLHRGWLTGTEPQELKVIESAVPNGQVRVNPGLFVVHRGAISGVDEGPYFGGSLGTDPIPTTDLPAAPTSNTRYDGIFAKILDKNISADAAGSEHGPYIDWVSGVVGGSLNIGGTAGTAGAPPATPDGYLPIAFIARATNDNVISQADITDVRRGAYIAGTPRVMFPWDISNISGDTGYMLGEERYRPASGVYPAFLDRWDGTAWRGTRGHRFAQPAQTTANTLAAGAGTTLATGGVVIPWPGFAYRIGLHAELEWDVSFSSGNSRALNLEARVDTDVYVDTTGSGTIASPRTFVGPPANVVGVPGGIIGIAKDTLPSGGRGQAKLIVPPSDSVLVSDGASHTVYVRVFNDDDTSTANLVRGVPYRFQVEIIPA